MPSRYVASLRGMPPTKALPLFAQLKTVVSRPILRNSFACMCLAGIGDVIAQRFELFQRRVGKAKDDSDKSDYELLDFQRAAALASYGLAVAGPLYSLWYPFLDDFCHPLTMTKYGVWAAPMIKVMIEMTFLEPVILALFFGYMNVIEGGTVETYTTKMSSEFLPTYKTSLTVWPPFMLLSFRFVPVQGQTIAMNLAMVFWDAFLSYQNSQTTRLHGGTVVPVIVVDAPASSPFLRMSAPPEYLQAERLDRTFRADATLEQQWPNNGETADALGSVSIISSFDDDEEQIDGVTADEGDTSGSDDHEASYEGMETYDSSVEEDRV
jgi:Mpv17 / PMP22 family